MVLIKPDGMQRGLIGEIIQRLERKGLKLAGVKMLKLDDALVQEHYAQYQDQDFFPGLKKFMQSSPVVVMIWEGVEVVKVVRGLVGPTLGREAPAGSIRGDFGMSIQANLVHASDSVETAEVELKRFFKPDEIFDYPKSEYTYLYTVEELENKD